MEGRKVHADQGVGRQGKGEKGRVSVSPQAMDRRKKMYEIPAPPSRFSPPLE